MQYSENYVPRSEDERKRLEAEEEQKIRDAAHLQELKDRLEGLPGDDIQSQSIRNEIEALENSNQK